MALIKAIPGGTVKIEPTNGKNGTQRIKILSEFITRTSYETDDLVDALNDLINKYAI